MIERYPRVGLVLIRTEVSCAPEFLAALDGIRADTEEIVNLLRGIFDLQGSWVIDSAEMLATCLQALNEEELDMVVLASQTQVYEGQLVELLQAVGSRPLVIWCYLPWQRFPQVGSSLDLLRGSGPVGMFDMLGVLRNLGVSFFFTYGSPRDSQLITDLRRAGWAACLRHALRQARFGLLPGANDRVMSASVDASRLQTDFGPLVVDIPANEYNRAVESFEKAQIESYLDRILQQFPVEGVSKETLAKSAQMALALSHLANTYRLDVLGVCDPSSGFPGALDLRSALYPGLLGQADVLFQPVADLCAATANFILHRLTGSPTMLMEILFWEEPKNLVVGGHLGLQNPALAAPGQARIRPAVDLNCPNWRIGAQFQMMAHAGRVTFLQLRPMPQGWQAIAAKGVCLEGQPWIEDYPHAVVRLDAPINHFLHQIAAVGATCHWILAYGSVIPELEAFFQMENVPLEIIQ